MNNNEKIAQYIQNIFHLENLQADDDTYTTGAISSTHWGNGITIRWSIGNKFVDLTYSYSMGTHTCGFGADDTAKSASEEIVKFIGKILISQADSVDPATGMGQILAWPYNCNLAYVENTIEALQYGNNPINESRKAVKSGFYDDGEVHGTENWKGKENNWRGVPGVHMIWHGEWSDPELEYDGKVANMYDVESTLYEYAQEDGIDADNDTEFNKYCQEHDYDVYSLFSSKKSIKSDRVLDDYHNKEIYRQAFASLIEDTQSDGQYPGSYRVLVDGCFETNFSADSQEEAIQKFKDYFAEKKSVKNSKAVESEYDESEELDNSLTRNQRNLNKFFD